MARVAHTHTDVPGLAARRVAADIIEGVLRRRRALDELLDSTSELAALEERDRGLARALVATVLRRLGTLRHLLWPLVERGLPPQAPRVETALLLGAAQILFLDVPDHAAVDLAVRLVQADRYAARFAGLVNAVLRRLARDGKTALAALDMPALDTPDWLLARWTATYGAATAHAIAAANGNEGALDLTVKSDPEFWAAKLNGRVLATGTVRTIAHGAVTALPGFAEGAWWVQDAAAALPARLFGDVAGRRVADLCAAPGGKTAQLAAAGAHVTAVDRAPSRMTRLADNLARLSLAAELVCADAAAWAPEQQFDAVLLDAPCSATGTIRRHPDIPWLKSEADIVKLAGAATPFDRARRGADHTRRHADLLHLFAGAGGERRPSSPMFWRATQACGARRSPRRRFSAMLSTMLSILASSSAKTATCARCHVSLPMPICGSPASTASMPRGW